MLVANIVMAVLGLAFARTDNGHIHILSQGAGSVIAVAIFVSTCSFAYSWGPTTWVYCAEIFPLKVRARCIGLTTMAEWTGVFLINQFAPMMLSSIGFGTFAVLGVFTVAAVLLAWWLPETKGVLLEHMDRVFDIKFGQQAVKEWSSEEASTSAASSNTIDCDRIESCA